MGLGAISFKCSGIDISPRYDKLTNGKAEYHTWVQLLHLEFCFHLGLLILKAPVLPGFWSRNVCVGTL